MRHHHFITLITTAGLQSNEYSTGLADQQVVIRDMAKRKLNPARDLSLFF